MDYTRCIIISIHSVHWIFYYRFPKISVFVALTNSLVYRKHLHAAHRHIVLQSLSVDEQTGGRTAETHYRSRAHRLIELFRITYRRKPAVLTHLTRANPTVILSHARQKMVAYKTVERVLAVRVIIIIQTRVFRICLIINRFRITYKSVYIIYPGFLVYLIRLHERRIFEITLLRPERTGHQCRTAGTANHHTLMHRVFATEIRLIDILCQGVRHSRKLQCLGENGKSGVFRYLVREQQVTCRYHIINTVHHTIGHRIVTGNHARRLVHIVNQGIVVHHVRIGRQYNISIVHIQLGQSTLTDIGCEERAFLYYVRTYYRVASLCRYIVHRAIARAGKEPLYTIVVRSENGKLTVSAEHREVRSTLQYFVELTELIVILFKETRRCQLRG